METYWSWTEMSERLIFTISENIKNPEHPKRHIVKIRKSGRQLSLFPLAYLILKKSGRVKFSRWNWQSVQNQVTRLSLVAFSLLFHEDDDDANLWQLGLFVKIARIHHNSQGNVCNDNVAMFSPLAPIKIFRLNRSTRRDACAISAHNHVCCRSSPVYPGAPNRQNQVCYIFLCM